MYGRRREKLPQWYVMLGAFGRTLLPAVACATCVPPSGNRPRLAAEPEIAGVAWQYEVQAGRAGTDDLAIDARFAPGSPGELRVDRAASAFVYGVEYASGSRWVAGAAVGTGWAVPCASGCRVRYRFALRGAATTLKDVDTAIASGDVVVAPPSTWLLRPAGDGVRGRFRFHVSCQAPTRFEAGTHPSGDGAADTFEASTGALDASSFAVFGRFDEGEIRVGGGRVLVATAPQGLVLSSGEVTEWVRRAVHAIAAYLGRFPAPRSLVVVVAGLTGPTRGETLGEGGPAVLVRVGQGVDAAKTRDDWVMTHELLHVSLPSLSREHSWLDEGIATYVEPVVRVRDGQIPVEKFWGDLVDGLPQGMPEAGDEGLDRTHTWGRTYWGGALFCFVADVTLRERTQNARSLDDALRAIAATGATVEQSWTIDQFLDAGDRATGTRVLHELYRAMALGPETVDLAALWARLGVRQTSDHRVTFDDRAPLAAIRRSITEPAANRPIPGPANFF